MENEAKKENVYTISATVNFSSLFASNSSTQFSLRAEDLKWNFLEVGLLNEIELMDSYRQEYKYQYENCKLSATSYFGTKYFGKDMQDSLNREFVQEHLIKPYLEDEYPKEVVLEFEGFLVERFYEYLICNVPKNITDHITSLDVKVSEDSHYAFDLTAYTDLSLDKYFNSLERQKYDTLNIITFSKIESRSNSYLGSLSKSKSS